MAPVGACVIKQPVGDDRQPAVGFVGRSVVWRGIACPLCSLLSPRTQGIANDAVWGFEKGPSNG